VRVHEELEAEGVRVAYSTLTAFARRQGLGRARPQRAGRYPFAPGEEMQHDTSPHEVAIGGRRRRLQCAALVLCYSRRLYAQVYPTFNRFYAKSFLTEALRRFGGAAGRCLVDNTSVVIAAGSGREAVIAPEMEAFAERFGFRFEAHAVGDANRSARVERPFYFIERNFYPGRSFSDLADCNQKLAAWCEQVAQRTLRELGAQPAVLFEQERPQLRPLPLYIPEVYALHTRLVDVEGLVHLHTNRYSVDEALIGRRVQVRETLERVRLYVGPRCVAEHARLEEGAQGRSVLPAHRRRARSRPGQDPDLALPEEERLRAASPLLASLIERLRQQHGGRAARSLRRLHRLYRDYPRDALLDAVRCALDYRLTDLASSAWCWPASPATSSSCRFPIPTSRTMRDELAQLCQSLKLRRMPAILERELARAEKQGPSYESFLARLLREELHAQQERSLEHRISGSSGRTTRGTRHPDLYRDPRPGEREVP
jgi:transposase